MTDTVTDLTLVRHSMFMHSMFTHFMVINLFVEKYFMHFFEKNFPKIQYLSKAYIHRQPGMSIVEDVMKLPKNPTNGNTVHALVVRLYMTSTTLASVFQLRYV